MWFFEFVPKFSQQVNNFLAFFSVFFWQARKPFLNWDSPDKKRRVSVPFAFVPRG